MDYDQRPEVHDAHEPGALVDRRDCVISHPPTAGGEHDGKRRDKAVATAQHAPHKAERWLGGVVGAGLGNQFISDVGVVMMGRVSHGSPLPAPARDMTVERVDFVCRSREHLVRPAPMARPLRLPVPLLFRRDAHVL